MQVPRVARVGVRRDCAFVVSGSDTLSRISLEVRIVSDVRIRSRT